MDYAETIQASYDSWSASYDSDRNLTRDLAGETLRRITRDCRYGCVIEAGCGTGGNTGYLSSIAGRVIGLDFSAGMLSRLRAKIARLDGPSNVELVQCDLSHPWPVNTAMADLVVIALVLEHVQMLGPVFREAFRTLKPGGELLVFELHPRRQSLGKKAEFNMGVRRQEIPAFLHTLEEFSEVAESAGFAPGGISHEWHSQDGGKPPRILTMCWKRK